MQTSQDNSATKRKNNTRKIIRDQATIKRSRKSSVNQDEGEESTSLRKNNISRSKYLVNNLAGRVQGGDDMKRRVQNIIKNRDAAQIQSNFATVQTRGRPKIKLQSKDIKFTQQYKSSSPTGHQLQVYQQAILDQQANFQRSSDGTLQPRHQEIEVRAIKRKNISPSNKQSEQAQAFHFQTPTKQHHNNFDAKYSSKQTSSDRKNPYKDCNSQQQRKHQKKIHDKELDENVYYDQIQEPQLDENIQEEIIHSLQDQEESQPTLSTAATAQDRQKISQENSDFEQRQRIATQHKQGSGIASIFDQSIAPSDGSFGKQFSQSHKDLTSRGSVASGGGAPIQLFDPHSGKKIQSRQKVQSRFDLESSGSIFSPRDEQKLMREKKLEEIKTMREALQSQIQEKQEQVEKEKQRLKDEDKKVEEEIKYIESLTPTKVQPCPSARKRKADSDGSAIRQKKKNKDNDLTVLEEEGSDNSQNVSKLNQVVEQLIEEQQSLKSRLTQQAKIIANLSTKTPTKNSKKNSPIRQEDLQTPSTSQISMGPSKSKKHLVMEQIQERPSKKGNHQQLNPLQVNSTKKIPADQAYDTPSRNNAIKIKEVGGFLSRQQATDQANSGSNHLLKFNRNAAISKQGHVGQHFQIAQSNSNERPKPEALLNNGPVSFKGQRMSIPQQVMIPSLNEDLPVNQVTGNKKLRKKNQNDLMKQSLERIESSIKRKGGNSIAGTPIGFVPNNSQFNLLPQPISLHQSNSQPRIDNQQLMQSQQTLSVLSGDSGQYISQSKKMLPIYKQYEKARSSNQNPVSRNSHPSEPQLYARSPSNDPSELEQQYISSYQLQDASVIPNYDSLKQQLGSTKTNNLFHYGAQSRGSLSKESANDNRMTFSNFGSEADSNQAQIAGQGPQNYLNLPQGVIKKNANLRYQMSPSQRSIASLEELRQSHQMVSSPSHPQIDSSQQKLRQSTNVSRQSCVLPTRGSTGRNAFPVDFFSNINKPLSGAGQHHK